MRHIDKHTRTRLLTLLGLGAAADLVALAATGAFRFDVFSALVALLSAGSAVASFPFVRRWLLTEDDTPAVERRSLSRTKKILILAMCAGVIAYVGGRGTFAVFTAETTNSSNGVTSGTLVLGNANNTTGTTCYSYSGTVVYNAYGSCQPLWNNTNNMAPGLAGQSKLTVDNEGSIDASVFYLSAPWPRTTLATALSPGAQSSIIVTAANGFSAAALPVGSQLQVSYGSSVEPLTVTSVGATSGGNTTINVSGTLVKSYAVGARVENLSANTGAANTDCYDQLTTAATVPVTNATPGTSLPFVTTTNNPLCNTLQFYIQETKTVGATTVNYCWYGLAGGPGQCRTPTTATTAASIPSSGGITTLNFASALTGNIKANDTLSITDGTTTVVCKATADAYIGDTSVTVQAQSTATPCTPTVTIASGASIKDTLAFASLDAGTQTISNFDTLKRANAPIQLYPLNQDGTNLRLGVQNTAATKWLNKKGDAGYTRTFYIGAYMPVASGQSQNQLQGLLSTFSLNWHIEQ